MTICALFRYGDWLPLKVSGEREENLIVYARVKDDEALIVAVPRLVFGVTDNHQLWVNTSDGGHCRNRLAGIAAIGICSAVREFAVTVITA